METGDAAATAAMRQVLGAPAPGGFGNPGAGLPGRGAPPE